MLLHIGGDVSVRLREIVVLLDGEAVKHSAASREFIELAKAEGRFVATSREEPKSYVITTHLVYASPISALTLARRAELGEVL